MSISEFYGYARKNGVTVIQAHPYSDGATTPTDVAYIDAIEAYNANPRHENYTEKAFAFARENGLPITAGSDSHRYEDIARSGIFSSCEIKSAEDYIRLVMSGAFEIIS